MALISQQEDYHFTWCGEPSSISFSSGSVSFGKFGTTTLSAPFARIPFDADQHRIDLIIVTLADKCNLGCTYCSVDGGAFKSHKKETAFDVGRVIDFVVAAFEKSGAPPSVSFMGGEPLLQRQLLFELIERLSSVYKGGIDFSMPTNLTLLTRDDVLFLKRHRVHLLASIDGPKHIHDRNRPQLGGRGSFDQAMRGLRYLLEADYGYMTARPTIARIDEMREVFEFFQTTGVESVLFGMDFMDVAARYDRDLMQRQLRSIVDLVANSANEGSPIKFILLQSLIEKILTAANRPMWEYQHCGAGISSLNVGLDGKLYPCHNYALENVTVDRTVGQISDGIDAQLLSKFVQYSQDVRAACSDCALSPLCPGGCVFLEETVTNYWTRGTCGLKHLPFLELVEAAYYAICTHMEQSPSAFLKAFAPRLYGELRAAASQVEFSMPNAVH